MNIPFLRPKGTRDLAAAELARTREVTASLQASLAAKGYQPIEPPLLEYADLYLRKFGGEVVSQMYAFTDRAGNRLCLRPEFTASVIRAFIEAGQPTPVCWQYAGPVFRFRPQGLRQFHQVGAELIGADSPASDAEIISLACAGLRGVGMEGFRVVVGDMGLLSCLLDELGLSPSVKVGLLASMAGGELEKVRVGVEGGEVEYAFPPGGAPAREVVGELVAEMGREALGSREMDEVVERFLRRRAQEAEPVGVGAKLLLELSQLRGEPGQVLSQVEEVVGRYRLSTGSLVRLRQVVERAEVAPAWVVVDMGLARGLAYYTGPVFEIYPLASRGEFPLCGGGRYDGLVRALGGGQVPALGFAYYVEAVVDAAAGPAQ